MPQDPSNSETFNNARKRKLLDALKQDALKKPPPHLEETDPPVHEIHPASADAYDVLLETESDLAKEPPLTGELAETAKRLQRQFQLIAEQNEPGLTQTPARSPIKSDTKNDFGATLSTGVQNAAVKPTAPVRDTSKKTSASRFDSSVRPVKKFYKSKNQSVVSGGSMADLSGYKDLSKAPISLGSDGDDDIHPSHTLDRSPHGFGGNSQFDRVPSLGQHASYNDDVDVDTEFSGNVKTLIRLVSDLPSDITKQTGAQVIRLTMEGMGIAMEDILSEAQSAQSEMLDAVRANIKKIEEYKTVIRKLETDIKYYQGKANELSEIIDLFILSNSAGNSDSRDSGGY